MSDLFNNFDSNGAVGDETSQDRISMASPLLNSPMANTNNNSNSATNSASNSTANQNGVPLAASSGGSSTNKGSNIGASGSGTSGDFQPLLTKPRLMELVKEVDTSAQLDEDVEELLMHMVDDFIDDAIKSTSSFAKHRKSNKIEVRDVQLHLERKYNIWIPGFGTDELRPYKRAAVTEAHKQRLALIRKTIKKY